MATDTTTLRMTGCRVDTQSVTISFSEAVDMTTASQSASFSTDQFSALNPANYMIFAPNSGFNNIPLSATGANPWTASALPDGRSVVLEAGAAGSGSNPVFAPGDWVQISIASTGIALNNTTEGVAISGSISGRVPNIPARQVRDVEDAISYPVLTEEVAYRPSSPVGVSTSGAGGIAGPGAFNIGQTALQAVTDVLGWKINPSDPKGFIGALTQSFDLADVEGHVESKWVPRTYAVQTDLGGGITGAQASLYMRAKDALDQSLRLLDGLYPLDPDADPEYVRALREMARSQMTEIVKEFGVVGLPSILRINTYFQILLGQDIAGTPAGGVQLDPDSIEGTLGEVRDTYGIYFDGNPFNNSVGDEQDITNFRVISDYMTSLCQSWIANRQFFIVSPKVPAFFGTQLVLISRQFNVVTEAVNEVRFALDSVFIGPNERQMLLLKFADHRFPSMYLEDILDEVNSFVSDEGPRLLRDGGKISITNNILPVVKNLKDMIQQTRDQRDRDVPKGFKTARVRRAMDDLYSQLDALKKLTDQVEQQLPTPLTDLAILGISTPTSFVSGGGEGDTFWRFSIFGNAFNPGAEVSIYSVASAATSLQVDYYSAQRIDVCFDPCAGSQSEQLQSGSHDVTVTNPDGQTVTLSPAFNWTGCPGTAGGPPGNMTAAASPTPGDAEEQYNFTIEVNNPWGTGSAMPSASRKSALPQGQSKAAVSAAMSNKSVPAAVQPASSKLTAKQEIEAPAKISQGPEKQVGGVEAKPVLTDEDKEALKKDNPSVWKKIEHLF